MCGKTNATKPLLYHQADPHWLTHSQDEYKNSPDVYQAAESFLKKDRGENCSYKHTNLLCLNNNAGLEHLGKVMGVEWAVSSIWVILRTQQGGDKDKIKK